MCKPVNAPDPADRITRPCIFASKCQLNTMGEGSGSQSLNSQLKHKHRLHSVPRLDQGEYQDMSPDKQFLGSIAPIREG